MSADDTRDAQRAKIPASPGAGRRALEQLFARQKPRVYRRALRLLHNPSDAEEATQEVFVRALRGAEGFEEQSEMGTWLHRITTNYCLNLIRDRSRRAELDQGQDFTPTLPPRSDDLCLLHHLLSEADPLQAQAVLYVHRDGLSHDEAAEKLGVSRRTVGNLLERFRAFACEERGPDSMAA
jgi:RNA polymerase sigma-70 factor (ECF subfamily)